MIQAKTTCGKTITNVRIFESGIAGILEGMTSLGVWNPEGIGSGLTEGTRIVLDSFITGEKPVEDVVNHPAHYTPDPKIDPYNINFHGHKLDPYRVVELFGITDMPVAQAIKKLLRLGAKHKDTAQDVRDAITSLERWEQMRREDEIKRLEGKTP